MTRQNLMPRATIVARVRQAFIPVRVDVCGESVFLVTGRAVKSFRQ